MKVKGWESWEFNKRGDLYHRDRPDLVFTAKQLEGLHWYHQLLADERGQLRQQVADLEAALLQSRQQAIPQRGHIVDTHIHRLPINSGLYMLGK